MINNFKLFGLEHILSLILPIIIGTIFILLAKEYPKKTKLISIYLAITIILIRSVRYIFDISIGTFQVLDLLSIHVCNIDLILLIICLIRPNRKLFTFSFLVGIPTALAVALLPGQVHADPGMARAVFFIMSHMMLVMGAIYLLFTYKFEITKKDIKFYYLFSLIGIVIIYIFNKIANANFMYLNYGPKNTVLEAMYANLGPFWYIAAIYILLISLLTGVFFIYKYAIKKISCK